MKYIIGTRGSKLALVQAESIRDRLREAYPKHIFEIQVIQTTGDRIPNQPLNQFGNKGVFVREIEEQLLRGKIDIGVHSMKDMPAELPEGLRFAKAWKREDARDVLVLREAKSLRDLPPGAVIGTGSPRRELQLKACRPDIHIVPIRGNVDTRIRKMHEEKLDGIVLAAAGLNRLGLSEQITCYLEPEQMIPAPAQGVLALEIRQSDALMAEMLDALSDAQTEQTTFVERTFLREMNADCHMPVGAYCRKRNEEEFEFRVMFGKMNGGKVAQTVVTGTEPEQVVADAAAYMYQALGGTVTLVGGGPGDDGLITVRGLEAIRQADCILYDRLVPPALLTQAGTDCELIYVGKENHHHTMCQEEINTLLLQKAVQYERVVRLKGGDSYVFGRGAEEALALKEKGIRVEIIPGISSCLAGPASAGIPITHRGLADGFHVVTAHNRRDELAEIDFEAMARGNDTCLFLMGLGKLGEIAKRLIEAGMPADRETAVISKATTGEQRVCVSELQHIESEVQRAGLRAPALIVVGKVVGLRDKPDLTEERKLSGKRYLVPRIGKEHSELVSGLRALGAFVQEIQVGEIVYRKMRLSAEEAARVDWLIFTSKNGVSAFFACMRESGIDVRLLANTKIAAIGKKTAEALQEYGVYADFVPERQDSNALAAGLKERLERAERVWCIRPERIEHHLREQLEEYCEYSEYIFYENRIPAHARTALEMWEREADLTLYDGVVFTCASSVRRLYQMLSEKSRSLLAQTTQFSIGVKTTEALKELGINRITEAECADYEGLIQCILAPSLG